MLFVIMVANLDSIRFYCFSYGVVIWEMLTGDTPHKGLAPNTIIYKATKGELDNLKIEESFPQFWKQLLNS